VLGAYSAERYAGGGGGQVEFVCEGKRIVDLGQIGGEQRRGAFAGGGEEARRIKE